MKKHILESSSKNSLLEIFEGQTVDGNTSKLAKNKKISTDMISNLTLKEIRNINEDDNGQRKLNFMMLLIKV